MSTLQNGDSFLVQRTDSQSGISTNYQVSQENLMANLADDDLLLVQRTSAGISTNYSITGSALKEDLGGVNGLIVPPVEVLTPINGAGITEFNQYEPLSSAITAVGEAGTIAKETDNIQSVASLATGAANLDRNNASWINIPNGVPIGTSEFTFECFFYVDSFNDYGTIFDSRELYTTDINQIYLGTSAENIIYFWAVDGSQSGAYRYRKNINTGQWYHLALVRDSNNLMHLYIDGTHADKSSGDYYHPGSINTLTRLGQSQLDGPGTDFVNGGTYFEFDGKLSNVRVTVGQALYTSDFTVPSTPLTTTGQGATASNVKLLCCQSTTDVTAAAVSPGSLVANGHAVSTSGPGGSDILLSFPTNTNFSGLSVGDIVQGEDAVDNGGSVYLDGNTVIKISTDGGASSIFNIPANTAFTIEAWVYPTNLNTYNNIMSGWDGNCGHHGVLFHILNSGQIFFGGLGGATHTSNASNPVTLNNWHHVAVTRNNGGNCEFFIDGVSAGSFNNNNAADNHNCGVFIGANMDGAADGSGGNYRFTGYISNLRYVVGHETYTSAFTPPTEPLTKTSQSVPSGACRFLALQDDASYSTNSLQVEGLSAPMTADYGTPVASEQNPFGVPVTPVAITAINDATTPPTITVDGGTWTTSDRLTSSTPYETSLTFTNATELANMVAPLEMADATGSNSLTPTTSNVVSTSFTPSASFFSATTYTGTGSTKTIENGIDLSGEGGLIWIKNKSTNNTYNAFFDTERGTERYLYSNGNGDESYYANNGVTSFNSNGFTIKGTSDWWGLGGEEFVSWTFRKAPGFFDIVTWTGDGSGTRDITHSLGSAPAVMIWKKVNTTSDWPVYHKDTGTGYLHYLNTSSNKLDSSLFGNGPTTTNFPAHAAYNLTGQQYIAYLFADNPSNQIKCGSYLGNATGGGAPAVPNQIDCGFRPKFLLIKNSGNDTNWIILDDKRGDKWLYANEPDPEGAGNPAAVVFNDTGFSLPTGLHWVNQDNTEHIFVAIGEAGSPDTTELTFQDNTALSALTSGMTIASNGGLLSVPTFSVDTYSGNNSVQSIDNGIDLAGEGGLTWIKYRDGIFGSGHYLFDTERGSASLQSNLNNEQYSPDDRLNFDSSGFNVTVNPGQAVNANDYRYVAWSFRKAPGFFDIQTYTGNGDGNGISNLPHQLGSEPGMIIIKRTSSPGGWYVYHKGITSVNGSANPAINNYLLLDGTNEALSYTGGSWASTATTFSAPFGINSNFANNQYVAYLFADNPSNGIKCGSYTGTGADNNNINCGFEPKWVMIKNIDESGGSNNNKSDWYISDHKRGFSSHYGSMTGKSLSANTANSELSDATIVVSATGFKPATGGAEYNKLGVKYIYMAIGSPTAPGGPAIGTLVTDADPSTNKVSVDTTSWPTGNTVTGPSLGASLTSILEVSGNTIFGNGSSGTWMSGYYAEGSEINAAAPGPSEITFTSQNQGTPTFSGVDATLASRTWTLESGTTATGPWTLVDTYSDFGVLNTQTGATPWTENKPTLQPNTYYRIKVKYNSTNAESVESVYNTFKTGSN